MSLLWDSEEQRERYLEVLHYVVPSTGGEYAQPWFCYKHVSCEYGPENECGCTRYEENAVNEQGKDKNDTEHLMRYHRGGVWDDIMKMSDDQMLPNDVVDCYI